MKKILLLFGISFIICSAFNKPLVLITDYRDAYIGNYYCKSKCQVLNSTNTELNTNVDTLTVVITKEFTDSILKVTIRQNSFQMKLRNNNMYPYPSGRHISGKFFSMDSIHINLSPGRMPNTCTYRGKKR